MSRGNPGGGFVVQVGDSGHEAACAVSRERGWDLVRFDTLQAAQAFLIGDLGDTALIVCNASDLQVRPLLALAREVAVHSPRLSLGYLYGRGPEALAEAADKLIRPRADESGPIRVFSMFGQHYPLGGARASAIDTKALRERGGEIIRESSPLDFFIGHSNGQDMGLGGRVLCGKTTHPVVRTEELRVMPCFQGGVCQREASGKGPAMLAGEVGARRIINLSCWGVWLHDRPFAPEFAVGEALLKGKSVTVMVAAVRALNLESPEVLLFYHRCVAGMPFGRIANLANQFRMRSGEQAEWICFGDPSEALSATSVPAQAEWTDGALRLGLPGHCRQEAHDIVAHIDPERLPEQPILIQQTGRELLPAVVDPCGAVCVCLPAGWRQPEVRYWIVDRRMLESANSLVTAIIEDLDFVDCLLAGARDSPMQERVPATQEAVHRLRDLLDSSATSHLPVGEAIGDPWPGRIVAPIMLALHELAAAVLDVSEAFARSFGLMQPRMWMANFYHAGTNVDVGKCPSCGSAVDERVLLGKLRRLRRCMGFCDACGFQYDGDPAIARFISVQDPVRAGCPLAISVDVTNPYTFQAPVSGYFILDLHEFRTSEIVRFNGGTVSARQTATVRSSLPIRPDIAPGTYLLGAAILVGARLNVFQRTFQIAPACP
jgi:hypothetical protein